MGANKGAIFLQICQLILANALGWSKIIVSEAIQEHN